MVAFTHKPPALRGDHPPADYPPALPGACHGVAGLPGPSQGGGWPRFLGDFVTSDPALQDCILRAMAMSGFLDLAEAAFRGGAARDQVRALLLRAVLEGMQW